MTWLPPPAFSSVPPFREAGRVVVPWHAALPTRENADAERNAIATVRCQGCAAKRTMNLTTASANGNRRLKRWPSQIRRT